MNARSLRSEVNLGRPAARVLPRREGGIGLPLRRLEP